MRVATPAIPYRALGRTCPSAPILSALVALLLTAGCAAGRAPAVRPSDAKGEEQIVLTRRPRDVAVEVSEAAFHAAMFRLAVEIHSLPRPFEGQLVRVAWHPQGGEERVLAEGFRLWCGRKQAKAARNGCESILEGDGRSITVGLCTYLGWSTVWGILQGWKRLQAEAGAARTFGELAAAGERFGKLLGANTARVMVMVTAMALGSTAGAAMSGTASSLPAWGQAAQLAAAEGLAPALAAPVASVMAVGETLTVGMAMGSNVVMAAGRPDASGSTSKAPATGRPGAEAARDVDALKAAGQAADRAGLTKAGRALAKHGGREGSVFPRPTGNPAAINRQGQAALDEILENISRTSPNKFGGMDYFGGARGGGARFDAQGNFIGFLEP